MKHCVITGAAEGIGRALARRYATAGYTITGIDRDAPRAAQTQEQLRRSGAEAVFLTADLSEEADLERITNELSSMAAGGQAIDLLVHNAGISAVGRFAATALPHQQAVLDVNLLAPLLLTAELLRRDAFAAGSSLVFIASLSAFVGYPGAAVYAASKDGLDAYARSLRVALAGRGMHVLTVYPGPTRTAHARRYSPDNRREARRMPPERLADEIVRAVNERRPTLIPGPANRVLALLGRYAPALADAMMRRALLEPLDRQVHQSIGKKGS